jgi:hypothetical protein
MIGPGISQQSKPLSCISNRNECFPSGISASRRSDSETNALLSIRKKSESLLVSFELKMRSDVVST